MSSTPTSDGLRDAKNHWTQESSDNIRNRLPTRTNTYQNGKLIDGLNYQGAERQAYTLDQFDGNNWNNYKSYARNKALRGMKHQARNTGNIMSMRGGMSNADAYGLQSRTANIKRVNNIENNLNVMQANDAFERDKFNNAMTNDLYYKQQRDAYDQSGFNADTASRELDRRWQAEYERFMTEGQFRAGQQIGAMED